MAALWAYGLALVFIYSILTPMSSSNVPDTCIVGPFHKKMPAPETRDFLECKSWQNLSCCTADVSDLIHHHRAEKLYDGYTWDLCGPLSTECERYLKNEECFYQCEPMLYHYKHKDSEGYIQGAPVCKSYCEAWFNACENDKTCVVDWLGGFHYINDTSRNQCPEGSMCKTFRETYKSAKGMCNMMWGESFMYSEDDKECLVMEFNPISGNPNFLKDVPVGSGNRPVFALSLSFFVLFRLF